MDISLHPVVKIINEYGKLLKQGLPAYPHSKLKNRLDEIKKALTYIILLNELEYMESNNRKYYLEKRKQLIESYMNLAKFVEDYKAELILKVRQALQDQINELLPPPKVMYEVFYPREVERSNKYIDEIYHEKKRLKKEVEIKIKRIRQHLQVQTFCFGC
jgi:hypothetical protein